MAKAKTVAKKKRNVPVDKKEKRDYDNSSVAARQIIAAFGTEVAVDYTDDVRHIVWNHNNNKYEAVEIGTGWRFHINGEQVYENQSFAQGLDYLIDQTVFME